MQLVALKYGYRLSIGSHDIFLTLGDLTELQRLLQTGEHGLDKIHYLTEQDLEAMPANSEMSLIITPKECTRIRSLLTRYCEKTGHHMRITVKRRLWPKEDHDHPREYILRKI